MKHIDIDYARARLIYNPDTGVFLWRPREGNNRWNTRYAGKPAGRLLQTAPDRWYLDIMLRPAGGFLAHRLAWAMHYGEQPGELDHINGDRLDNRIENLRAVSHETNQRNMRKNKSNTSGVNGVVWDKNRGKWIACVGLRGRFINLGRFDTVAEAADCRQAYNEAQGFHPSHGQDK